MTTPVSTSEQLHEHLRQTIEEYFVHRYERDLADRGRKLELLLDWARKVSAKTGIPLETL